MPRINPLSREAAPLSVKAAFEEHIATYNTRITNTNATLAHSQLVFDIYMQWYPLYEKVKEITGNRTAVLYAWAVSRAASCSLCAVVFRKILIESGENLDMLELNRYEKALLNFGSAISQHKGCIANHVYNNVALYHTEEEMVILIAFAGQMIATNIFNNVVETEIDEYLIPFLPVKQLI